jgi:hypothetical protein
MGSGAGRESLANVRFGSLADITRRPAYVRFTPKATNSCVAAKRRYVPKADIGSVRSIGAVARASLVGWYSPRLGTTANSPGAFLNSAHDRLAPIFLAIVADSPFIVGKSLEVEDGLAPRRSEVTAHPIGDHFLPVGI